MISHGTSRGKVSGTYALTPAQWLPKPATSQFPERRRSLRELWSPCGEGERCHVAGLCSCPGCSPRRGGSERKVHCWFCLGVLPGCARGASAKVFWLYHGRSPVYGLNVEREGFNIVPVSLLK